MGNSAGTLYVAIKGDTKDLDRALVRSRKNATSSAVSMRKSLNRVGKAAIGVTSAVVALGASFATYKLLNYAKDSAIAAGRFETLGVVMHQVGANAGYSADEMDRYDKALRKTGISMEASRTTITRLTQARIDLTKTEELARIAQNAAVIGNINSSEAFQSMVHGIQSAQVEVLRTIGINVVFEQGYKKLAKQLGKTAAALTSQEKTTSRLNQVLEYGSRIAGTYEAAMGTAGKQILSLERYHADLKVTIGDVFGPAMTAGVKYYTSLIKEAVEYAEENKQALQDLATEGFLKLAMHASDSAVFMVKAFSFVHNAIDGVYIVTLTLTNAIIGLERANVKMLETLLKPWDLIFDGLAKLGAIDVNPFEGFQIAAAGTQKEIEKVRAETVSAMLARQTGVEKFEKVVESAKEKFKELIELSQIKATTPDIDDTRLNQIDTDGIGGENPFAKRFEALQESLRTEEQALADSYLERQDLLNSWFLTEMELAGENEELKNEARETWADASLQIEADYQDQKTALYAKGEAERLKAEQASLKKLSFWEKVYQQKSLKGFAQGLQQKTALASSSSRTMFEINKIAAISEATIDAYHAIVGAYKVGAKIGGPPLGAAFAAAAGAFEFAIISSIASQSYGGGIGGGGMTAGSVPIAPSQIADVVDRSTVVEDDKEVAPSVTVNYYHYGNNMGDYDEIARELVPAIEKAQADGV